MRVFPVQLWTDHGQHPQPYQKVEAWSQQEAAEALHGGPLVEAGSMHKLRARVRSDIFKMPVMSFYEP